MTRLLFTSLFFVCPFFGMAQQSKIDSLAVKLEESTNQYQTVDLLNLLASEYVYEDSIQTIFYAQKAIDLSVTIGYKKGIVDSYYHLAWLNIVHDELDSAQSWIRKSFELSQNYLKGTANAWNSLGVVLKRSGNFDSAIYCYKQSSVIFEELQDQNGVAISFSNLGNVYRILGDYPNAIEYSLRALKIDLETGDQKDIAGSYASIGIIYKLHGDYPKALDCYLKSLRISEEIGATRYIVRNLSNIAVLYHEQEKFDLALSYHMKCLKIREELDDKTGIVISCSNIAVAYDALGNYDEALKYHLRTLSIEKGLGNKEQYTITLLNIGENYLLQSKYQEALEFLSLGLEQSKLLGTIKLTSQGLKTLGETYFHLGEFTKAARILKECIQLSKENNYPSVLRDASFVLHQVQKKNGNFDKALDAYEQYHLLYDSLLGAEKAKQLSQLEIQYETEKKAREIENLEQAATIQALELSQSNNRLVFLGVTLIIVILSGLILFLMSRQKQFLLNQKAHDVEQKLLRVQMNPHFIFNAMSAIQDYMMKGDAKEASRYLTKFSKLVRQVLDTSRSEFISLDQEVSMLENYLSLQNLRRDKPFKYEINIDGDLDPEEISIPPMFAQPFVENSIEHGMNQSEEQEIIKISFALLDDCLVLKIEDNGMGIEESQKTRRENDHVSHATAITKERIELFKKITKKDISFNTSQLSKGTQVSLHLPYEYN